MSEAECAALRAADMVLDAYAHQRRLYEESGKEFGKFVGLNNNAQRLFRQGQIREVGNEEILALFSSSGDWWERRGELQLQLIGVERRLDASLRRYRVAKFNANLEVRGG